MTAPKLVSAEKALTALGIPTGSLNTVDERIAALEGAGLKVLVVNMGQRRLAVVEEEPLAEAVRARAAAPRTADAATLERIVKDVAGFSAGLAVLMEAAKDATAAIENLGSRVKNLESFVETLLDAATTPSGPAEGAVSGPAALVEATPPGTPPRALPGPVKPALPGHGGAGLRGKP